MDNNAKENPKIKIEDASKLLGTSPMGLRLALRNGKFSYFGEAWKNEEKWTYYINAHRLYEYIGRLKPDTLSRELEKDKDWHVC